MSLEIEKGIPLPPTYKRWGQWTILRDMQVGDSVFLPGMRGEQGYRRAWWYGRRLGFGFVTRTVEGGCRIWRVK